MHTATTEQSSSEAKDGEGHFNKHTYGGLVRERHSSRKRNKKSVNLQLVLFHCSALVDGFCIPLSLPIPDVTGVNSQYPQLRIFADVKWLMAPFS